MVTASETVRVRAPIQLTPEHLVEAQKIAERLHDGVRIAHGILPRQHRAIAAMARFIGMDRTVCQRLISVVTNSPVSPDILTAVPAPRTIMAIAEALIAAGIPEAEGLRSAAQSLDDFFLRTGGSQRAFGLALRKHASSPSIVPRPTTAEPNDTTTAAGSESALRQQLFQIGRQMMRASSGVSTQISIYAPSLTAEGWLDHLHARGVVGHRCELGGVPLVFNYARGNTYNPATSKPLPDQPVSPGAPTGPVVLEQFSSSPAPTLHVRARNDMLSYIVDQAHESPRAPFDLILCDRLIGTRSVPTSFSHRLDETFAFINFPAETLILDVYLPRALAVQCIPGLDVHTITPNKADPLKHDRWATRLSSTPDLIVLGPGLRKANSKYYPRQGELTRELFDRYGYNPEEFVGFRCEERYPEWRMSYRLFFDYGDKTGTE